MAHLAEAARIVGVAAHQRGHVEGHRQAARTVAQYLPVALIGLAGVAETGELADRPGTSPVAGGVHAAGERVLARPADPLVDRLASARPVHRVDLDSGQGGEVRVTQPSLLLRLRVPPPPTLPTVVTCHDIQ